MNYEEKKAELEATYLPSAAAYRLEKWLELNPDKSPKAKKTAKKESKKEE